MDVNTARNLSVILFIGAMLYAGYRKGAKTWHILDWGVTFLAGFVFSRGWLVGEFQLASVIFIVLGVLAIGVGWFVGVIHWAAKT